MFDALMQEVDYQSAAKKLGFMDIILDLKPSSLPLSSWLTVLKLPSADN